MELTRNFNENKTLIKSAIIIVIFQFGYICVNIALTIK